MIFWFGIIAGLAAVGADSHRMYERGIAQGFVDHVFSSPLRHGRTPCSVAGP